MPCRCCRHVHTVWMLSTCSCRCYVDAILVNRKAILAGVGLHFFGPRVPAKKRRKHVKELFSALNNDGQLRGWLEKHGFAMTPPTFELPWMARCSLCRHTLRTVLLWLPSFNRSCPRWCPLLRSDCVRVTIRARRRLSVLLSPTSYRRLRASHGGLNYAAIHR